MWVNDREGRKLLQYSMSGEHLQTVKHGLLSYNFFLRGKDLYLNSGDLINSQSKCRVNVWNAEKGNIENQFIEQKAGWGYVSVLETTNFSCFDDTLSYAQAFSNTIYQLNDNRETPRVYVDFGKCNMPENYVSRHANLRLLMEDLKNSGYASRMDGYYEGKEYLFFMYSYKDQRPFVWYSKKKKEVYDFIAFEDDFLFPSVKQETGYKSLPVLVDDDYVYVSMDAYRFRELYDEAVAKNADWTCREKLYTLYNRLTDDSNALIIRYKIK